MDRRIAPGAAVPEVSGNQVAVVTPLAEVPPDNFAAKLASLLAEEPLSREPGPATGAGTYATLSATSIFR